MFLFIVGILVGATIVLLAPQKHVDWLRQWIINQWQKLTNKG